MITKKATLRAAKVLVPLFEIASNPKVNLTTVSQRRFRLIPKHCPVCKETVESMEKHLELNSDPEHTVLSIMEL